jgi:hypothetical protein
MTSSAETARYVHRNVTRFNHVNVATAFHTLARLRRAGGGAPAAHSKKPPPAAAAEEGEEAAALLLAGRAEELVLDFAPQESCVFLSEGMPTACCMRCYRGVLANAGQ